MKERKTIYSEMKRFLAVGLCAAMMLESTNVQVFAEEFYQNESVGAVSEDNRATVNVLTTNVQTTDGNDQTSDGDEESIGHSGTYYGMSWSIDEDGNLEIGGEYQSDADVGNSWKDYADAVTSVKVTASNVESISGWFSGFRNLEWGEFSDFDTSQVTSMDSMFENCQSIKRMYLNLYNHDFSNVTQADYMFYNCYNLEAVDDSYNGFNFEKITSLNYMFANCCSLARINMSEWDLSSVTSAEGMLKDCNALQHIHTPLNLNIEVALPYPMVDKDGNSYTSLPMAQTTSILLYVPWTLEEFDHSGIRGGTYRGMYWTESSDGELLIGGTYQPNDLFGRWWGDTIGEIEGDDERITSVKIIATDVTDTSRWFEKHDGLKCVDLSEFDSSKVTTTAGMFSLCGNLTSLDLSNFDSGSLKNMSEMFYDCDSLTDLDLSGMDLGALEDWSSVLRGCYNLQSIKTPANMNEDCTIFLPCIMQDSNQNPCIKFNKQTGSTLLTRGVGSAEQILASGHYYGMTYTLTGDGTITVSGEYDEADDEGAWGTYMRIATKAKVTASNVRDTGYWFVDCANMQSIDLSEMHTDKVVYADYMFNGCRSLTGIDLSGFDFSSLEEAEGMLGGCKSLKWIKTPTNLALDIYLPVTMKNSEGVEYTSLPKGLTESITLTVDGFSLDTDDGDDEGNGTDTNDGDDIDIPRVLTVHPIPDQTYTGKAIKPAVTVTYGKDVLTLGKDYTVSYKNNINTAKADADKAPVAVVKGKGNYTGTMNLTFNIVAKELTEENTDISEMVAYENGNVQTVKPVVKLNGKKLKEGKDYTIEYPDKDKKVEGAYKLPGTYNVVIKGEGNYGGNIPTTMTILSENQVMASKLKIGKIAPCKFEIGKIVTPISPKVTYKGKELILDKDYAITYEGIDRAGKATMILTGLKNTATDGTYVVGTVKKTFTITGTALKKARVEYDKSATYTGDEICPKVTLTINGSELAEGRDYTVEYSKNVNAGKATILLTGQGGYTGTVKKTFTIKPSVYESKDVKVSFPTSTRYDSKGAKPKVKVRIGDELLVEGKDYTVIYKNNKKVAGPDSKNPPTVTIKGKGNYKFTKTSYYYIPAKELYAEDITITAPDKFVGDKNLLSVPVVKDQNGKKLKLNKDYKILRYYVNGKEITESEELQLNDVVTIELKGKGNYDGEASTTYRIAEKNIAKTKVNKPQLEYNGGKTIFKEEELTKNVLEVRDNDNKLVYGTDYIIVGYKNNTKKGTATVIIQGIGKYGGTKEIKFKIVSKKMK